MEKNLMDQGRIRVLLLMFSDVVSSSTILFVTLFLYHCLGAQYSMRICLDLWFIPLAIVLCSSFAKLYCGSLFYPGAGLNPIEELKRLTLAVLAAYILLFAFLALTQTVSLYTRLGLFVSLMVTALLLPICRYFTRLFMWYFHVGEIPILILGAGKTGMAFAAEIEKDKYYGFRTVGFLDDHVNGPGVLGKLDDVERIVREKNVHYLVSCLPLPLANDRINDWFQFCYYVTIIPTNRVFPILWSYPVNLYGFSGLEIGNKLNRKLFRLWKASFELLLSCVILIFILPVCILLAILIKITSRGPVFYKAKRLGLNGKSIEVYKFRTMYADADKILEKMLSENPEMTQEWKTQFKLKNDLRITPIGKFLRKTSLDELPQFWNVIRGEMAVIGPRPIVEKEKHFYQDSYDVFSRVKPGITGLWQVSGRSNTTYERRVNLDLYYINNWSVWLDYYILLKTFKEVFLRRGAY